MRIGIDLFANGTAARAILLQYKLAMIFRVGFQTFELQRAFELPKPLMFLSRDEALKWLKQTGFLHPEAISRFREYLVRFSGDPQCFRLTDHETLDRMAGLLYTRQAVIVAREERAASQAPSQSPTIPVAFPLSERSSRRSTVSSNPVPAEEPATFDSRLDAVAQAAALVTAADEVMAFCPE
jgi:hypothetical protein